MHRLGISNWSFDAFEGDDNDDDVNAPDDDNGDDNEYDDDLEFLIKALCTCATSKDKTSEKRFKNALGLNCNGTTIETGPDQKGQHQCVCKVSGIAIWSNAMDDRMSQSTKLAKSSFDPKSNAPVHHEATLKK